jgi:hypothetical protein
MCHTEVVYLILSATMNILLLFNMLPISFLTVTECMFLHIKSVTLFSLSISILKTK